MVDKDLPRSLAADLRQAGFEAQHTSEARLHGQPDREIRRYAAEADRVIVTRDVGMIVPRDPAGPLVPAFVLVRIPSAIRMADAKLIVIRALQSLAKAPPAARVVVVEPGRIRVRRPRSGA